MFRKIILSILSISKYSKNFYNNEMYENMGIVSIKEATTENIEVQ